MAADEKIGEADILSRYCQLAIVRERRGQDQPGRGVAFAFYSPMCEYRSPCCRCQGGRLESSVRIMAINCNLKIHNALREIFRKRNRLRLLPGLENCATWSTRFAKNALLL